MIRRFCDGCGAEITDRPASSNSLIREKDRIKVEVMVAVDGTWNSGEVCEKCVLAAVNEGAPAARTRTGWVACGKGPCCKNDGHEGKCSV